MKIDDKDIIEKSVAGVLHPGETFLVALSGGADSVALLASLVRTGHHCRAIHCNYGLRGDESERDQAHAVAVAAQLDVEIDVVRCDVVAYRAVHPGCSVEMACRELRYEIFERLRQRYNLDSVAVGHHLEDNIETMWLNMLRGSGIKGLAAMRERRGIYVRPLLWCTKDDILHYLANRGLGYVTDSSNLSNDYRRNALRNEVLPMLQQYFPDTVAGLSNTLHALQSQLRLLNDYIVKCHKQYVDVDGAVAVGELISNESHPVELLFELLNYPDYCGFNQAVIDDVVTHCKASDTGLEFKGHQGHEYRLEHSRLIPVRHVEDVEYVVNLDDVAGSTGGILAMQLIGHGEFTPKRDANVAYFDYDGLRRAGRLVLRHPRIGDRIKPWGMQGSRLLSDIFSDLKIGQTGRRNAWVLEANGQILWLVGIRASRLNAVISHTTTIARLNIL